MKIIGVVWAGFYAVVATALSSSATGDAATPAPAGGPTIKLDCAKGPTAKSSVSQPNTTVTVTCGETSTLEPSASALKGAANDIYLDATCTHAGVLSSVCPGATVTAQPASRGKAAEAAKANVFFPQLPASEQVVCLKCAQSDACTAVITVAAALPQGPQACAALGSSVTLRIDKAGGSARFACGKDLTLMPSGATRAYADDCKKEETLEGMTRTPGEGNYVTLKADKLKQKKLCYLCKPNEVAAKTGTKEDRCTVYVEVNGSTRFSSRVGIGVALPCVAAMLRFT